MGIFTAIKDTYLSVRLYILYEKKSRIFIEDYMQYANICVCVFYINIWLTRLRIYLQGYRKLLRVVTSKEENWVLGADV